MTTSGVAAKVEAMLFNLPNLLTLSRIAAMRDSVRMLAMFSIFRL